MLFISRLLPFVSLLPDPEWHITIAYVDNLVTVPGVYLQRRHLRLWLRNLGPATIANELWALIDIDCASELMRLDTCWI